MVEAVRMVLGSSHFSNGYSGKGIVSTSKFILIVASLDEEKSFDGRIDAVTFNSGSLAFSTGFDVVTA